MCQIVIFAQIAELGIVHCSSPAGIIAYYQMMVLILLSYDSKIEMMEVILWQIIRQCI